jgi:hypothetical protein
MNACSTPNSSPAIVMPPALDASVAMRLLRRRVVRIAPISPSRPAASAAAGTPCSASMRKMTLSPVAIECLVRGIGMGKAAAMTTIALQPRIWISSAASLCATLASAATIADAPASAMASHRRVAAAL